MSAESKETNGNMNGNDAVPEEADKVEVVTKIKKSVKIQKLRFSENLHNRLKREKKSDTNGFSASATNKDPESQDPDPYVFVRDEDEEDVDTDDLSFGESSDTEDELASALNFDDIWKSSSSDCDESRDGSASDFDESRDGSASDFDKSRDRSSSDFDESRDAPVPGFDESSDSSASGFDELPIASSSGYFDRSDGTTTRNLWDSSSDLSSIQSDTESDDDESDPDVKQIPKRFRAFFTTRSADEKEPIIKNWKF